MTRNIDVFEVIEEYAPLDLAEEWDHPGLTFGTYHAKAERILLALDLTAEVVREAVESDVDLLIVHHPPLFNAIHSLTDATAEGKMQLDLISNGISCYSAHTNLDRAKGGTAKALAGRLDLDVDDRGYQLLQPMAEQPDFGYGLYASLRQPQSFLNFAAAAAERLAIPACQRFSSEDDRVTTFALFPGSFDESSMGRLEEIKAELLITGEIKHHIALMLEARGIHVLAVGHDVSERDGMHILAAHLRAAFPDLEIEVNGGIDYN
ncbi:MAG: Nif3-like dinuclear metal center hexameric protein [Eubacteriales bacterium]|nr:Nif3-like dinuclear metal center hexameric protein [Eubacteriales bacterium]MDD4324758.1 Nif3-like dinuclear metal center hexameric protein [Eubacteriales bacterium]MDD4541019.1 Nif3-like dinuclear metal center hexameric protein [Eubacteriales bacterium]